MSHTRLTVAERAVLDAYPGLQEMLHGDGVHRDWLHERTGIPQNHLTHYFHALGLVRASSNGGKWRFPDVSRLRGAMGDAGRI